MRKVFDVYLTFLKVSPSEAALRHVFAALRAFMNKVGETAGKKRLKMLILSRDARDESL